MDAISVLNKVSASQRYRRNKGLNRVILSGTEHATIDLPTEIVQAGGKLDIYDDVLKYFQIRIKNGRPVLQLDRYVGYIPLNDQYALDVTTRVPVGNLERLIGIAVGYTPLFLANYFRAFSHTDEMPLSVLDVLTVALLAAFDGIWSKGLLTEYRRHNFIGAFPVGSIDPFRSAWRTQKAGRPITVSGAFRRTRDYGPNRVIKAAFERLLAHYRRLTQSAAQSARSLQLRRALGRMEEVSSPNRVDLLPISFVNYLCRLPQYHEQYVEALLLSQPVLADFGLAVRGSGTSAMLPTILIDMETVFECYARVILSEIIEKVAGAVVRDGNKGGPAGAKLGIFTEVAAGIKNPAATPDIVISKDGLPKIVIDVKYKPSKDVPDRSDLNQVITYATRYACRQAIILYSERKTLQSSIAYTGAIGSILLYVGRIDLNAADMPAEENRFASAIIDKCL